MDPEDLTDIIDECEGSKSDNCADISHDDSEGRMKEIIYYRKMVDDEMAIVSSVKSQVIARKKYEMLKKC